MIERTAQPSQPSNSDLGPQAEPNPQCWLGSTLPRSQAGLFDRTQHAPSPCSCILRSPYHPHSTVCLETACEFSRPYHNAILRSIAISKRPKSHEAEDIPWTGDTRTWSRAGPIGPSPAPVDKRMGNIRRARSTGLDSWPILHFCHSA